MLSEVVQHDNIDFLPSRRQKKCSIAFSNGVICVLAKLNQSHFDYVHNVKQDGTLLAYFAKACI